MQAQIQALLAVRGAGAGGVERGVRRSNMGPHMKVAKPAIFNEKAGKVGGFVTACRLYLRMKMREGTVEEQVQWVLSYVQGGLADVWKENVMEELETREMEYETVEEFLTSIKKVFGNGEEELVKAAKLRKLEQGGITMEEFVQEFKRAERGSRYEGRLLIEKFKKWINGGIRRKLMEAENQLASIKQWYKRAMALNRNWRENKREEERLRGKKEIGGGMQKQEKQIMPQPLVWQRRQMPSQQATTGPAPMEEIERMNVVVVRGQEQGQGAEVPPRQDPYVMEVDQGRNCYACGGFGHMARHYRNKGRERAMERRRMEYGGERIEKIHEHSNNLKEMENLELLD